jgi:hypothetical protein
MLSSKQNKKIRTNKDNKIMMGRKNQRLYHKGKEWDCQNNN